MASESEGDVLRRIESKIAALLAITLDEYLREHPDLAKPRPRTVDQLLADVGVAVKDIASLLGKTEQAVYLQLSKTSKRKAATRQHVSRGGASAEEMESQE